VVCNARTLGVEATSIHIEEPGGETRELGFAYAIYWPAFKGVSALVGSPIADARGAITVNEYLQNPAHPNIYALGLCISRPPLEKTAVPVGQPASVYSIQNEVDTVVDNIGASLGQAPLTSIAPRRARWIGDLGERGAAHLAAPHVPLRDINWLRQGRWVHSAKVEFEQYFISRIKLGTGEGRAGTGELAGLVAQLRALEGERPPAAGAEGGPAARRMNISLRGEPLDELRAMAEVFHRPPEQLAADLLSAAVHDAHALLGDVAASEVDAARRALLEAERPERQPGAEFEGGAP
jgi:sulfide:quinone oxidoreductase